MGIILFPGLTISEEESHLEEEVLIELKSNE
jgi:hypothetical protein